MSDKGYNLLWDNCSDATKKLLEHKKIMLNITNNINKKLELKK